VFKFPGIALNRQLYCQPLPGLITGRSDKTLLAMHTCTFATKIVVFHMRSVSFKTSNPTLAGAAPRTVLEAFIA